MTRANGRSRQNGADYRCGDPALRRAAVSTRCGWRTSPRRAKVAKGTLYLHYKDKEDLFMGIMNDGLQSLVERIEESLSERRCRRSRSCW